MPGTGAVAAAAAGGGGGRTWRPSALDEDNDVRTWLQMGKEQMEIIQDALNQTLADIEQREQALGGRAGEIVPTVQLMRQELHFNVCGVYMKARRSTLCVLKGSVLATLCGGRFDEALIKDANERYFLPFCSVAFQWLIGELALYEVGDVDDITLPDTKKNDATFSYWVEYLTANPSKGDSTMRINIPPVTQDNPPQQQDGQPEGENEQPEVDPVSVAAQLPEIIRKAMAEKACEHQRLTAIKPLLKSGNNEDDALVSIDVFGTTVTITMAVAKSLGEDSTLANRFIKYTMTTQWPDHTQPSLPRVCVKYDPSVMTVPVDYVRRVADIVTRAYVRGTDITAEDVQSSRGDTNDKAFRNALNMYALAADRYLGPIDGLLTTEHLHKMRQWCEGWNYPDAPAHIPLCVGEPVTRIYRATVDGWRWLDFFDAVRGHSPLLLICKVADSNELFAVLIEGPIEVTGPAQSHRDTRSWAFKLRWTDSQPHVGYIGWNSNMLIAGTQERATEVIDFTSPASDVTAVLGSGCLDFSVRLAAQQIQIGAPAAASDETLKRCQGVMVEEEQTDEWRQWERPGVRPSDHGWDGDRVFLPVSVKGFHFDIDEFEAYKLA
ncbi:unnamed protein product [Vitrella brassicaformis CCMP3155]|uniref:Uncharacterized protein n=1 Tax=Vitrella brassicaformis (strain CCMP3155) TaxID=1169540 RepID=A0A0G4H1X5_VITBC|nr:unnamed protein product [Vitrella brassicaformis CCMP3155]|eukprot:CEM37633.1 unnamed protein product [Vitrella brassicaformis CCMP3155]